MVFDGLRYYEGEKIYLDPCFDMYVAPIPSYQATFINFSWAF